MIAANIQKINQETGTQTRLIAVSKTKPVSAIEEAYAAGQRLFGENKVQELVAKAEALPKDIEWHMIGHLQRNKVKYMAPFVKLIHAVDSFSLLEEINKQASKNNRVIDCLLQIYIATEETKFGLNQEELEALLQEPGLNQLQNIRIVGLMGMASFTEDSKQVRNEFKTLKSCFERLKSGPFKDTAYFKELSMGMSGDYRIAIEEGSTLIRIGSQIFGSR